MAENTAIEWADHTFNPWEGCQKVGPGCDHCYAETRNARFGGGTAPNWGPGAPRRRTSASNWSKPLKWNATQGYSCRGCGWRGTTVSNCPMCAAEVSAIRQRVFCASLADWLDNEVPIEWLVDLLDMIRLTPNLDWLLLSKRIGNLGGRLVSAAIFAAAGNDPLRAWIVDWWSNGKPPSNVWLGATVVNQEEADRDIPKLLAVPARVRFLSIEPMLGSIDLTNIPVGGGHGHHEFDPIITGNPLNRASIESAHVHWVIAGGESGPGARPAHPDWFRSLRDQCAAAGVPFLFKQWGEWSPGYARHGNDLGYEVICAAPQHEWPEGHCNFRVGKRAAGRLLDGVEHNGFPA